MTDGRDFWPPRSIVSEGSRIERGSGNGMIYLQIFLYLQLLDVVTTLIGMRVGLVEASPFVRTLMHLGPATGLALSKLVACILAGFCIWLNKRHLVQWINYWYAGLVVWNMTLIFGVLKPG